MLFLALAALLFSPVHAEDELVFVQTLWRHGDRIPKETYPTDPYQRDYWGMPWGEITQTGLEHLFLQGQNLRKLYVETGFVNGSYDSEEITLSSADANRCVQSGMAMMAGFYSESPLSLPSVPSWPSGWYPVPIHTTPKKEDRELEIYCPAADAMQAMRELTPKFQNYLASNWNLYALLSHYGGQGQVDITYQVLKDWATTVRVEREDFNLTLPDWITDDVYNQLLQAYWDGHDFLDGLAGFGVKQDDKLIKLKGGFLLHEWRTNLKNAVDGKKGMVKYHGYSAHDHTVTALLHTMGAKQAVMGVDIAQYAATVICELWKKDAEYFVRFLYIDNCTSSPRPITRLLNICPDDSDFCPYQQFYDGTDAMSTKKDEFARSMNLLLSLLLVSAVAADELLFVQTLWRHGDRTPTSTYPSDPYQEDFWGVPWGELTTRGQKQHFLQGQRLRRVYVDGYGLVSGKYNRNETVVRSSDYPRCIQSALSNMAGFYAGSPTHPTDVDNWPSDWTPIPIHTVPQPEDRILECPISNSKVPCPVVQTHFNERIKMKNFEDFIASQWKLIADIMIHGGDTLEEEYQTIAHIYQAVTVEKEFFNLTLPDWITDDVYNALENAVETGQDYVVGGAGFDYPEDELMVRLRGGFLLKEWIDNMEGVINGTNTLKYQAYSGHDYSIVSLLMPLQAKTSLLGLKMPEYSATVACELWRTEKEGYAVKFMYSKDEYSEYVPITKLIAGCPSTSDFCSLDKFIDSSKKYIPSGVEECGL